MIIGITTTYIEKDRVERATVEYIQRVAATGAVPVLLPPIEGGPAENQRVARELVGRLDGLVLAGGGDVDPARYGVKDRLAETTYVSEARDALELELARLAHARDLPTLGICRGMQVLNVALGGTLCQDVNACGMTAVKHQQEPPYDDAWQRVDVEPGSLLELVLRQGDVGDAPGVGGAGGTGDASGAPDACRAPGKDRAGDAGGAPDEGRAGDRRSILVNSMHHQAVSLLAPGLTVSAISDDGLIESVEDPSRRFFLGVQWHPEYLDDNAPLFAALAQAAKHAAPC